ncbi:hypothetical protein XELAEV_18019675mg [Xenopus laevis]|uniref:Uncharacterized protein n=1 Tax=Xenopus laevis TaxID=8355 RepID=A0A974DHR9_XENLA|nr:hypothetical protein XELAEV_18019675mg [Xenopus laevis]
MCRSHIFPSSAPTGTVIPLWPDVTLRLPEALPKRKVAGLRIRVREPSLLLLPEMSQRACTLIPTSCAVLEPSLHCPITRPHLYF